MMALEVYDVEFGHSYNLWANHDAALYLIARGYKVSLVKQ